VKLLATIIAVFLPFCFVNAAQAQVTTYGAAARVNGVEISNASLEKNFEEYQRDNNVNISAVRYPGRVVEMRQEVLQQLIDEELVWQTVQAKQLIASAEDVDKALEEARAQFESEDRFLQRITIDGFTQESYRIHVQKQVSTGNYMQNISSKATVSKEEVHEFYVTNPDKLRIPETVRARHILLTVHPNADENTRQGARDRMDSILEQLANGADFSALANRYSEDDSSSDGGDLGYFQHGQMVKPFDDAAFALDIGETSEIVETVYGLHVIRVDDRQPPQVVSEDMASEQIYDYLMQLKRRQAIKDEISTLRSNAEIEILSPQ